MPVYSRQSPSPRYLSLQEAYRHLHEEGDPEAGIEARQMFDGRSLVQQAGLIYNLIQHFHANTLLDYGSGKGMQYGPTNIQLPDGRQFSSIPEFWGVTVFCYDPGHEPFSTPPTGRKYDAVISTDVLEHCPEEDLEWIVDEMFSAAGKFLYANAANYPARKHFANGENVHITLKPGEWWNALFEKVAARHNVPWLLTVEERAMEDGVMKAFFTRLGPIKLV